LYPWTGYVWFDLPFDNSARFGNCTGIGPCVDYEFHINNDIALAQWQYFLATGNETWLYMNGFPIIKAIADMWVSNTQRIPFNTSDTYLYETFNMTDPDEWANFRNNGAYTNAGIKVVMAAAIEAARALNETIPIEWTDIMNNINIPEDSKSGIILEYTGFNATTIIKQGKPDHN
jgi:trehalose/maltose hydrolase-like predicted phosphorylase